MTNHGVAGWPAALPGRPDRMLTVRLFTRWRAADDPVDALPPQPIRRDVPAGESLRQALVVTAPREPGAYRLEVGVEQLGGTDLTSPRNPASLPVAVGPRE